MFNRGPRFGNANEAGGPSSSDTDTAHDPLVWPPPSRPPPSSPAPFAAGRRRSHAPSRARSVSTAARGGNAAPRSRRSLSAQGRPEEDAHPSDDQAPYAKPWRQGMARQGTPAAGSEAGAEAQGPAAARTPYGPDQQLAEMLERNMVVKRPNVKWQSIVGLEDAKSVVNAALVLPQIMPDLFTGFRRPYKGVLLFGPPGTGKTMLAKAAATESSCTFFNVSAATLASKYRGESERMAAPTETKCAFLDFSTNSHTPASQYRVRLLFDMAREKAPSIIFIDEVDSLCSQRGGPGEHEASRRVKSELLVQIDGVQGGDDANDTDEDQDEDQDAGGGAAKLPAPKRVFVLCATNFPWDIDEALRRRLEKRVYIPLPGHAARLQLLEKVVKKLEVAPDVDLEGVAAKLDGYSGDDISNICRDAAMSGVRTAAAGKSPAEVLAMRQANNQLGKEPVTAAVFAQAIAKINPSVSKEDIERHEEWMKVFGSV